MAKPSVDGLQEDYESQATFTRVNINDDVGQKLASQYDIRAVPAFLLVSPSGQVLYRKIGGMPDRAAPPPRDAGGRAASALASGQS